MWNIYFLKNQFFQKRSSSEKAYAVQKYLLRKRITSADIFILNNLSGRKVALPKSNCPKKYPILKKWLLGRSFALKSRHSEKITATRKIQFRKRSSSRKTAAQKKQLLRKSNCCVEVVSLKECEEVVSLKIKLP